MNGKGVEKNCEEAIHWYEKAAIQGENDALLDIGNYYRYQEPNKAEKWYELAALSEDIATKSTAEQYLHDMFVRSSVYNGIKLSKSRVEAVPLVQIAQKSSPNSTKFLK